MPGMLSQDPIGHSRVLLREDKRRETPINVPIVVTEVDDLPNCVTGIELIAPMLSRMAATYGDQLGYALFSLEVSAA
jgi:hypothetical protein